MASGRVGGTKSLISGQVGTDIYQIRKNPDGSYSQVVSQKPTSVARTNTELQAAQKMCTSMVEALMRDIKEIGKISMQSGKNKSKSLNALSSFNLMYVRQDMKAHWYEQGDFVFPRLNDDYQLGGKYLISSGTLNENHFSRLQFYDAVALTPQMQIAEIGARFSEFCGLQWLSTPVGITLGEFTTAFRMMRSDKLCFVIYVRSLTYNPRTEEYDEHFRYHWMIAQPNPNLPASFVISPETVQEAFIVKASFEPHINISHSKDVISIGYLIPDDDYDTNIYYNAAFTVSSIFGSKRISQSRLVPVSPAMHPWLLNHYPTKVFGSWVGEPWNQSYPSPFQ